MKHDATDVREAGGVRAPDAMIILLGLWDIMHFSVEEDGEYLARDELEEFLAQARRVVELTHRNEWAAADAAAARMRDAYRLAWNLIEEIESKRDPASVAEHERQRGQPRFTAKRAILKARHFYGAGFL